MFVKLKAWLELITIIIGAIRSIEAVIPENGAGAAKLAALRLAIEAGWDAVKSVLGPLEEIWPKIAEVASKLVAAFNSTGLFKKDPA
jgi:hypothetical protein